MKLYYVTTNKFKIDEAMDYFRNNEVASRFGIEICIIEHNVQEILDADIHKIVERKVIDAFAHVGRPCVVEHGGLFFDALPKLPGALGKIIWDAVGERMCQFLAQGDSRQATARSCIGYCDGKTVKTYHGETRGRIAERARGDYVFSLGYDFHSRRKRPDLWRDRSGREARELAGGEGMGSFSGWNVRRGASSALLTAAAG